MVVFIDTTMIAVSHYGCGGENLLMDSGLLYYEEKISTEFMSDLQKATQVLKFQEKSLIAILSQAQHDAPKFSK